MMASISVRGEANAQALFDVLHGSGVTWSHPWTPRGAHKLTVQRPGENLREFIAKCFPEMRFSIREF